MTHPRRRAVSVRCVERQKYLGVGVKLIKVILAILVVAVVAFVLGGFLLPKQMEVERSTLIESDPATIFEYVNSLEKFHSWSPWADMDPNMQVEFSGPEHGVGSSMRWSSDVPQVGKGVQRITVSEPSRRVANVLEFDGQSSSEVEFELVPEGNQTKVTWRFRVDFGSNPVSRYVGLALDDALGPNYGRGLEKLEHLVENLPAIITEEVHYNVGDTSLSGYLAYPRNASGKVPGVLVVHEWWGHNDYVRKRADMLAELGYAAFALDMYGDGKVTGHPKEANAFMMEVVNNADAARARFEKALELLKGTPVVNQEKIAAIGYCFGGAVVMSMARLGLDLDGVVSYHGSLQGLAPIAGEVDARIMVFNGAADPFVPEEAKQAFKAEMDAANLSYEFIDYPGALHGFTNSGADEKGEAYGLPLKYDAAADEDSWQKTQEFFREIF
jgi:dienelactone hydrolase/carbon monoxide dehydrogenase subunit G